MKACRFTISEISFIREYLNLDCFRGVIGYPALILAILLFLSGLLILGIILTYRRGWKQSIWVYSIFLNRIYSFWPRWPFTHATATIGVASTLAFIAFIPLTNELIVNVTAVYATILFFQESLRKKVPLLNLEFIRPTSTREYDTTIVEGEGDDDVVKQLIKITNSGDLEADNIQVKSRSVNEQNEITSDWSQSNVSWESENRLPPNDETQCEIYVDTVDKFDNQEYLTEIKMKPNIRSEHLAVRKIYRTEAESE